MLAFEACASGRLAEEKALLDAGLEIRLRESGYTLADVRRELDVFLNVEVPAMKEKAQREAGKELTTYRWIWAVGGGVALAIGTSGSLSDPSNRDAQVALTGAAATVALFGYALYAIRSHALEECRAFLDSGSGDLAEWGRFHLRPSDEPAAPEVWRTYVERVHAMRSHGSCLRLRR